MTKSLNCTPTTGVSLPEKLSCEGGTLVVRGTPYLPEAAKLRGGALLFGASQFQQLVPPAVSLPWRQTSLLISAGSETFCRDSH